jgi:sterol desaturase/sphingolipid hydroxylase (fatty acid hydroxylase superfamily)
MPTGVLFVIDIREILALVLIFVPLERLMPQRADQRVFRQHWLNDTVYMLCNGYVVRIGVLLIIGAVLGALASRPSAAGFGPIAGLPIWVQVILAVIVADIGFYAHHRLFHAVPFLWRFHAVHHSIEELDWLAAHRVHPLDQIVSSTFSILPLYLLGFSAEAMVIWAFIYLIQSHLVHANLALNFGPLKHIIASPHFHHWHHSNVPGTRDTNFSGQLLFMDQIFGTLRLPAGVPAVYGTDDPVPAHYPLQIAWPFLRRPAPVDSPALPAEQEAVR